MSGCALTKETDAFNSRISEHFEADIACVLLEEVQFVGTGYGLLADEEILEMYAFHRVMGIIAADELGRVVDVLRHADVSQVHVANLASLIVAAPARVEDAKVD